MKKMIIVIFIWYNTHHMEIVRSCTINMCACSLIRAHEYMRVSLIWMKFKVCAAHHAELPGFVSTSTSISMMFQTLYIKWFAKYNISWHMHWVPSGMFKHYFIISCKVSVEILEKYHVLPMKIFTLLHADKQIYQYAVCLLSFYVSW